MNKNALKTFAIRARTDLIAAVSQRAYEYEVTDGGPNDPRAEIIGGRPLSGDEQRQRRGLIEQIGLKGFAQAMEEAAYTWFKRFIALRYMEVNGYLPTGVRVFTNEAGEFRPEILKEAMTVELPGLDREQILELLDKQDNEALFKLLLIAQCNSLSDSLPVMFERISDWTELLFPANLLKADSVIGRMIDVIPEADWQDQVQIIGWLYQYYNSEKKDDVFAALKKNVKITKENIPAATQLFTPDWIVRYMVENSLGRLWVEGHPNDELKAGWKYYLEEAEQEPAVQAQLAEIRKEYAVLNPEDIKVIDPCCGSGHILAYMFDVLVQIYEASGYTTRDAARSIVENNLYGLDIDDRAAQLAYFSVMMKACQYDRRFLKRGAQPHVHAIAESNNFGADTLAYFCGGDEALTKAMKTIVSEMRDAREYGSILTVTPQDWERIYNRFDEIHDDISMEHDAAMAMLPMVRSADALAQKYHVVVTNPPYMGKKSLNSRLSSFLDENYPEGKSELYSAFILKCMDLTKSNGFTAMITIHTWMFISSFEGVRNNILQTTSISSMMHTGAATFEELNSFNVLATAFSLRKNNIPGYSSTFLRLADFYNTELKLLNFENKDCYYCLCQSTFKIVPGAPFVYWITENARSNFSRFRQLRTFAEPKQGLATGDNGRFVRGWQEVDFGKIGFLCDSVAEAHASRKKWFPYNKGGDFRKWYGMNEYVIAFDSENYQRLLKQGNHLPSRENYFRAGLTWSLFGFENFGVRYKTKGFVFDVSGSSMFPRREDVLYILAFLASKVSFSYLSILAPTVNFQVGNIGDLPLHIDDQKRQLISETAEKNIALSKFDWDAYETSWDFKISPLIGYKGLSLEASYEKWKEVCEDNYLALKSNEEQINREFISIYDLSAEMTETVQCRDITVHRIYDSKDTVPDEMGASAYVLLKSDVVKDLVSYAVGCMFGRYSLDAKGLAYAGGEWDASKYNTFPADPDNIIPICDDEYFEDDIVGRFVKFIEVVYGADTLEENLKFIADALGGKGRPREVIRNYFLSDFYADHLKIYQKRPIYWLFDSGKKNGFKCLIYMHRYQPDTIARIRTDYVHEQQSRYRTAIADLEERVDHAAAGERMKLTKRLFRLKDQDLELRGYEEKIHHLADQMIAIDLDDGVKVNYAKFQDVLAKIK